MKKFSIIEKLLEDMIALKSYAMPVKKRKEREEAILEVLSDEVIDSAEILANSISVLISVQGSLDQLTPQISSLESEIRVNLQISKASFVAVDRAIEDQKSLEDIGNKINEVCKEISDREKRIVNLKKQLNDANEAYVTARDALFASTDGDGQLCPLCNSEIDGDRLEHILEDHNE